MSAVKTPTIKNRKAFHDYEVLETFEAGLALVGTEVKSVRMGQVSLIGAYVSARKGKATVEGMTIQPYEFGNRFNHEATRSRVLLLHKVEIIRLQAAVDQKGLTIVPLKVYFVRGKAKLQIGLCRGKNVADKRETVRRRTADREASRQIRRAVHS
jgi:SsrA-binding protein